MEDAAQLHPRLVLRSFLSPEICKELEFIHKSCSTVGYRPNVFSTTLHHLIATNSAHLIMPIVPIRERLKDVLEEHFGCAYELFVEFTGLISWSKGASIGWHSDDNRDYLKQRHFAVVCYLNSHGVEFNGGLFHFKDGEPSTIAPMIGDVLMYTADSKNIHSVSEVTEGERITLTLWFTRNESFDEDAKLINSLTSYLSNHPQSRAIPTQAPDNMYWFPPQQASKFEAGFDIRCGRLHAMGFDVLLPRKEQEQLPPSSSDKLLKLLNQPLHLSHGGKLFEREFVNILHALQCSQFYNWKAMEFEAVEVNECSSITHLSELELRRVKYLKDFLVKDVRLAEKLFGHPRTCLQRQFDEGRFCAAVSKWEAYALKLADEMARSFPYWKEQRSVFEVVGQS